MNETALDTMIKYKIYTSDNGNYMALLYYHQKAIHPRE
jgi:hypothetical protein